MSKLGIYQDDDVTVNFNGVTVSWYYTNFGHTFIRAQDLVKLLKLDADNTAKAKAIYKECLPATLQTDYLCRELAGFFLQHLSDLTGGDSKKLWNKIKTEFFVEAPDNKFQVPIVPMKIGKKLVPAFNMTQMYNIESVFPTAGKEHSASVDFAKEIHVFVPLQHLKVSDNQVQKFIKDLMAVKTEVEFNDYMKMINAAKRIKLVREEAPEIKPKDDSSVRSTIRSQSQEIDHLKAVLKAANIDPDSDASKPMPFDEAAVKRVQMETDRAFNAIRNLVGEQFASLYAQNLVLMGISEEIASIYGGWDHKKFVEMFDNQRILNLVAVIQKQIVKDVEDRDINSIIRLVEENTGKLRKDARTVVQAAQHYMANQPANKKSA